MKWKDKPKSSNVVDLRSRTLTGRNVWDRKDTYIYTKSPPKPKDRPNRAPVPKSRPKGR